MLQLNIRTYNEHTRGTVLDAIRRIVNAECLASRSPREPEFELADRFPLTNNDIGMTRKGHEAFTELFGIQYVELPQSAASDDFSDIPSALGAPYTYWGVAGVDADTYRKAAEAGTVERDIAVNHSPHFAPAMQPTLDVATQALIVAAMSWLAK